MLVKHPNTSYENVMSIYSKNALQVLNILVSDIYDILLS